MVKLMNKYRLAYIFLYTLLFIVALIMIIPILNILSLSLSDPSTISNNSLNIMPKRFSLINYKIILSNPQIVKSIVNSVFITVVGTCINLFLTSTAAYALTRPGFMGRNFFMVLLIAVMVFEPGLIQEYLVMKRINLLNSYWSVILYKAVDVYYLIILMRFFEEIPQEFIEAAQIDGAGHLTVLFKVIIPLAKPALATIGLFYAVFHWNEYFRASIYLNSSTKWPLQVFLRQFVVLDDTSAMLGANNLLQYGQAAQLNYEGLQDATIIIAMVPILLLYPIILKYYTKGMMEGGVKD